MYDFWLIMHFIGLVLGVGTGFAMFTLGLASKDMAPADRGAFMDRAFALSRNGAVGVFLLIVSGVAMVLARGIDVTMAWGGRAFHVKLALVVVLIGVFGYLQVLARKAKSAGGAASRARLPLVGQILLLLGIAVTVSAVLAFH